MTQKVHCAVSPGHLATSFGERFLLSIGERPLLLDTGSFSQLWKVIRNNSESLSFSWPFRWFSTICSVSSLGCSAHITRLAFSRSFYWLQTSKPLKEQRLTHYGDLGSVPIWCLNRSNHQDVLPNESVVPYDFKTFGLPSGLGPLVSIVELGMVNTLQHALFIPIFQFFLK